MDGRRVYGGGDANWHTLTGDAGLRLAEPAFGRHQALGLRASGPEFVALEASRFTPAESGIMAVAFAARGRATAHATLCFQQDGMWQSLPAYKGQIVSIESQDDRDLWWRLELRVVFPDVDRTYAPCVVGKGAGERYVGDLIYTYFPLVTNDFRPSTTREM